MESVKSRECDAVMTMLEKVACEATSANTIQKYYLMRCFIAANLPLDILAGLTTAVHASGETLKFFSDQKPL